MSLLQRHIPTFLGLCLLLFAFPQQMKSQEPDSSQQAFIDSLTDLAVMQFRVKRNPDSTILFAEQLVDAGKKWHSPLAQVKGLILISNASQDKADFERQLSSAEEAYTLAKKEVEANSPFQQISSSTLANALNAIGDYDQAIEIYKDVLANSDSLNANGISKIYISLGTSYTRKGDYLQALRVYQQATSMVEEFARETQDDPKIQQDLAISYYRLGKAYVYLADEAPALTYLNKSKTLFSQLGEARMRNLINAVYQSSIALYFKLKDTDKMAEYLQANRLLQEKYPLRTVDHIESYTGHWHALNEEWEMALPFFIKTLELAKSYRRPPENVAIIHYHLANTYLKLEQIQKALDHCQKGLAIISNSPTTGMDLPLPEQIMYPAEGVSLLSMLGKVWEATAKTDSVDQLSHQLNALACYQRVAELAASVRLSYLAEGSKLALSRRLVPIYERGIRVALSVFRDQGEEQYLQQAFSFAEFGKAVVLYESLQQSAARQSIVPERYLVEEHALKRDIAQYKKKIFQAEHIKALQDEEQLNRWKQRLFELEEAYQDLLLTLESQFPEYHSAKYKQAVVSLKDLQASLKDDHSMVLEYFEGDSSVFLFAVDKQRVRSFTVPKDSSLIDAIGNFQELMADREAVVKEGFEPNSIQNFAELGFQLYSRLVQPALLEYQQPIEHLIIIPDGRLYHIPFEALLHRYPKAPIGGYPSLPYLISDYICSYEYSAAMLCEVPGKRKQAKKGFAGFAPSYGQSGIPDSLPEGYANSRDVLAPLLFSQQEVQSIQNIVGGDAFVGQEASRAQFKEVATSYQILHLAMHALGNDANPDFSSLVFASPEDLPESGFFYTSDIQQLQLKADLAVLSACNTGAGDWVRGEGVLSIGRAFRAAGCPNVLMSHWQADDASTSIIMQQFYQELKEGRTQGEALRLAKMTYLQQNLNAHPHFWAAFVLVGADRPLWFSRSNWAILFIALAAALGGSVWFIRSRKDANTNRSHFQ